MENNIVAVGKLKIKRAKNKPKNDEIESMRIYGKYLDLLSYTEMILKKFPKCERFALASQIKLVTYEGMELIIRAFKMYDKTKKLSCLNEIDVKLKMLKVLIRISYKAKYITIQNYRAWSNKLFNIGNLTGGWINSCLKA